MAFERCKIVVRLADQPQSRSARSGQLLDLQDLYALCFSALSAAARREVVDAIKSAIALHAADDFDGLGVENLLLATLLRGPRLATQDAASREQVLSAFTAASDALEKQLTQAIPSWLAAFSGRLSTLAQLDRPQDAAALLQAQLPVMRQAYGDRPGELADALREIWQKMTDDGAPPSPQIIGALIEAELTERRHAGSPDRLADTLLQAAFRSNPRSRPTGNPLEERRTLTQEAAPLIVVLPEGRARQCLSLELRYQQSWLEAQAVDGPLSGNGLAKAQALYQEASSCPDRMYHLRSGLAYLMAPIDNVYDRFLKGEQERSDDLQDRMREALDRADSKLPDYYRHLETLMALERQAFRGGLVFTRGRILAAQYLLDHNDRAGATALAGEIRDQLLSSDDTRDGYFKIRRLPASNAAQGWSSVSGLPPGVANHDIAEGWRRLAMIYARLGLRDAAYAASREELQSVRLRDAGLPIGFASALLDAGYVALRFSDQQTAAAYYRAADELFTAVATFPDLTAFGLARTYSDRLSQNAAAAKLGRGIAARLAGDVKEAEQEFAEGIALDKTPPDAILGVSRVKRSLALELAELLQQQWSTREAQGFATLALTSAWRNSLARSKRMTFSSPLTSYAWPAGEEDRDVADAESAPFRLRAVRLIVDVGFATTQSLTMWLGELAGSDDAGASFMALPQRDLLTADIALAQRDYARAEDYYTRVLTVAPLGGRAKADRAAAYAGLAGVRQAQGANALAIRLQRQALAEGGADDPFAILKLAGLLNASDDFGLKEEGLALEKTARALAEARWDAKSPQYLHFLGVADQEGFSTAETDALAVQLADTLKEVEGFWSPEQRWRERAAAAAMLRQSGEKEAVPLYLNLRISDLENSGSAVSQEAMQTFTDHAALLSALDDKPDLAQLLFNVANLAGGAENSLQQTSGGAVMPRYGAAPEDIRNADEAALPRYGRAFMDSTLAAWSPVCENGFNNFGSPCLDVMNASFALAQRTLDSAASRAFRSLGVRAAAGNNQLAGLIRTLQDLQAQAAALRNQIAVDGAGADGGKTLNALGERIGQLEKQIEEKFPAYAALVNPRPLRVDGVARLLQHGEALLVTLQARDGLDVWLISSPAKPGFTRYAFRRLPLSQARVAALVGTIRAGLHPDASFDNRAARALYQELLEPFANDLADINHLMAVLDGPLAALPLGLLISQELPPGAEGAGSAWLMRKMAISVLPSVSSLSLSRLQATKSGARSPFLGIGNPVLHGPSQGERTVRGAQLYEMGGGVSPSLANVLSPLGETEKELHLVAEALGAPRSLLLGPDATEANVRRQPLTDFRVVDFATHGLLAGEFSAVEEPALVLTPPNHADSSENDGVLKASEITGLKFDADFIILSACDTAASQESMGGGEALSGLARAFIYAGGRSLLVSHWEVDSKTADLLVTGMIRAMASQAIGKAEALRRAIVSVMDQPEYAAPYFWAPFIEVGDGGLVRPSDGAR